MSGHSKWATIKHKKGAADKARGKLWAKLVRNIEVAAREGGGDPSANATLRTMVLKGKAEQLPSDKITLAIKRGTGELKADIQTESIMYEGYAPGGCALLVEVETDNRNRAAGDVRAAFSKNGGSIAEPGAVAWQFARRGVIMVPKKKSSGLLTEDELFLVAAEGGADDLIDQGDMFEVRCAPTAVGEVCTALTDAGIAFDSVDRPMVAENLVPLSAEDAKKVLKMVDALDDLDDVAEIYVNFDISDEILATLS